MYFSTLLSVLAAITPMISLVESKAVFAHYMVGNTQEDHIHKDIDDAAASGIDGFALNIGDPRPEFVRNSMNAMSDYARDNHPNFKLFVSMDLYAAGGASPKQSVFDYHELLRDFMGHPAYQKCGPTNSPLVSTFGDGGLDKDIWAQWKQTWANDVCLQPDFDSTVGYYNNDPAWWDYWGDVVDGLFSWESSWPARDGGLGGQFPGDVSPDEKVIAGAAAHGKQYIIGLSPLQYKNAVKPSPHAKDKVLNTVTNSVQYNTNIYRPGELNLPKRMENILRMSPSPENVEIQTWNDGPESHYIGNLWPEQNTDTEPGIYATEQHASHAGWRPLFASFITAFKARGPASSMTPPGSAPVVGAIWYKTILQTSTCPNNAPKPAGFEQSTDSLNWAVVLPASAAQGWSAIAYSNNTQIGQWDLKAGLNYAAAAGLRVGMARLEVRDGAANLVKVAAGGRCVSSGCPEGIYNMNPQVVGLSDANEGLNTCPDYPPGSGTSKY